MTKTAINGLLMKYSRSIIGDHISKPLSATLCSISVLNGIKRSAIVAGAFLNVLPF